MRAKTLSVTIAAPPAAVYAFVADPLNMPKWAAGLGSSISRIDGRWLMESAQGVVTVEFAPKNALGVLDHTVTLPDASKVYVPMRVIANGEGSELVFTLFQLPGMSDAQFAKDAGTVEKDLAKLKQLVEGLPK